MSDKDLQSFKDAQARQILRHVAYHSESKVQLTVQWHGSDNVVTTATFDEADVQEVDEDLVLNYWQDAGGRDQATNLGKDRVFKIWDEMKQHWIVQWVGYAREAATTAPKNRIAYKPGAGQAIVKWRRSLTMSQLASIDHYSLGIDYRKKWPAWYDELPEEVDWDKINMIALTGGDL